MMRRHLALAMALALAAAARGTLAHTITVHDAPSLTAALERARVDRRIDRILLADGVYPLAAPIVIDERLSGHADHPFELAGAPGAHAVLSGALPLPALRWEPWKDGIWRARYQGAPFQRLWLGARQLVRARYPNAGSDQHALVGAADATAPDRVARWHDPAGAVLHALHGLGWGGVIVPILGKDAAGSLLYGPQADNNRAMAPSAKARWVENVFEELDAPGEWFHDSRNGWLYLKPPVPGRPPARGLAAGTQEALVRIEGRAGQVRHVSVRDLVFERTEPTFLKAVEPLLRSDWKFVRTGALTIENADDVRVADAEFTDLGGHAVVVSGRAAHVAVTGNHIHGIGGTAIAFVGRHEAVRSPLFEYGESLPLADIDRTPGPASDAYPRDSSASDNLIHDIGILDKQAAGVQIATAARIAVDHNSIYDGPRAGINIGDGTFGGHRITHNDVFDTVRESGDHGAFNSWGRDRYWHPDRQEMDRRVAAEPSLALLDAVEPIVMRGNRFRCDHGWDIDLDDGASNYVIEDNLLLSGGLKLREGFARVVRNNILVNNTFHPHVWFDASHDVFESNVVMTPYQPIAIRHWGDSVNRNLFASAAGLRQARERGTDADSVAGDPGFANPLAGDYTVTNTVLAARVGFRNFAMNDFGVRPARLKALARTPPFSAPAAPPEVAAGDALQWLAGLRVKRVQTLGEQSAAGLGAIAGVLVLEVEPGSPAAAAGYRARDVIVAAGDGKELDDVAALRKWLAGEHGADAELIVVRDQARRRLPPPRPR
jgi:hypothetical protein